MTWDAAPLSAGFLSAVSRSRRKTTSTRQCLKRDRPALPKLLDSFRSGILLSVGGALDFPLGKEGDVDMLGLIALVLIVLWLLGFLAFHVSASLVHLLLVVGLVLLILHFVRGGTRTA